MRYLRNQTISLVVSLVAIACGGTTSTPASDAGAGADAGSPDAAPDLHCTFEPPGATFTFHVKNSGAAAVSLSYGCGHIVPITVDSAGGPLSLSTGGASSDCDNTCEAYASSSPDHICQDCGGGTGAVVAPGAVIDIAWDRRVYKPSTLASVCSGSASTTACSVGSVLPAASYQGTLSFCKATNGSMPSIFCSTSDSATLPFTFDLASKETTIDLK